MRKIINKLKDEHKTLVKTFDEVTRLGISSSEGQKKLLSAKAALLNHLDNEDRHLYPPLHLAAKSNNKLQELLFVFAKDMDKISQTAIEFFNKYEKGGSGFAFACDFGTLIGFLKTRIRHEEGVLFEEFTKLEKIGGSLPLIN